jgi:hypothetical protein
MQNSPTLLNSLTFVKEKYLNRVQMIVIAVCAKITVLLWGRRTGKTAGAVALRIMINVIELPRSVGFFAGKSYQKILSHMLPELIAVWQDNGLVYDKDLEPGMEADFCICKNPPPYFAKPLVEPASYKHVISFKNGAIMHLIGFDHRTTSNALATDWGIIDEAKQQPVDRIDKELMPTMSGHRSVFGDHPCHRSLLICSDGNIGENDYDWIQRYQDIASDDREIFRIIMLKNHIDNEPDPQLKKILTQYLHELQSKAVLYLEAATTQNLEILGIDYFRDMAKTLPATEFLESLMNEKDKRVKGGFYKFLDEDIHLYNAPNYNIIDHIGSDKYTESGGDCREDKNWKLSERVKIGVDFGGSFSWLVIAQKHNNTYFSTKNMWVEHPFKTEHLAQKFCDYCKHHNTKIVDFLYDVGGNKRESSSSRTAVELFVGVLRKNGWIVNDVCKGKDYIDHADKFRILEQILNEIPGQAREANVPKLRLNETTCYETYFSMSKAEMKRGEKGMQKDKKSESDKTLEQWKATHLSDALDNIICYENLHLIGKGRLSFSI